MSMWQALWAFFKRRPDVSFIIPFYASHDYLTACIASIIRHVTCSYEILVIDDGNKGYDFLALKKTGAVRIISLPENKGPGACRNIGIKQAKGNYIQFIDSDDELVADTSLYFAAVRQMNLQSPDIITGNLEKHTTIGLFPSKTLWITSVKDYPALIKMASFTAHLFKTGFLKRHAIGFPEDIRTAEDTVFLCRALPRAQTILLTDIVSYRYRTVEGSLSRQELNFNDFYQRFGAAGAQMIEALLPYKEALCIKFSIKFKYGIRELQKIMSTMSDDQKQKAFRVLRHMASEAGLILPASYETRKSIPVYWDDEYTRCVSFLQDDKPGDFYNYLEKKRFRIFKGEKNVQAKVK